MTPLKRLVNKDLLGQIQNLRFCDGRNLADIFSCPEFPIVRLDTMSGFSECIEVC